MKIEFDDENPEWTESMFKEAKTAAELFPHLIPTKTKINLSISCDADYHAALRTVDELMDAELNTPEGDALDIWVTLIEVYEAKHFPISAPNPIAAIKFRMEQQDLGLNDLTIYFGTIEKVKAFFDGKLQLTLEIIRKLHRDLHIPLEVLIAE